jgi:hypothetical protein
MFIDGNGVLAATAPPAAARGTTGRCMFAFFSAAAVAAAAAVTAECCSCGGFLGLVGAAAAAIAAGDRLLLELPEVPSSAAATRPAAPWDRKDK